MSTRCLLAQNRTWNRANVLLHAGGLAPALAGMPTFTSDSSCPIYTTAERQSWVRVEEGKGATTFSVHPAIGLDPSKICKQVADAPLMDENVCYDVSSCQLASVDGKQVVWKWPIERGGQIAPIDPENQYAPIDTWAANRYAYEGQIRMHKKHCESVAVVTSPPSAVELWKKRSAEIFKIPFILRKGLLSCDSALKFLREKLHPILFCGRDMYESFRLTVKGFIPRFLKRNYQTLIGYSIPRNQCLDPNTLRNMVPRQDRTWLDAAGNITQSGFDCDAKPCNMCGDPPPTWTCPLTWCPDQGSCPIPTKCPMKDGCPDPVCPPPQPCKDGWYCQDDPKWMPGPDGKRQPCIKLTPEQTAPSVHCASTKNGRTICKWPTLFPIDTIGAVESMEAAALKEVSDSVACREEEVCTVSGTDRSCKRVAIVTAPPSAVRAAQDVTLFGAIRRSCNLLSDTVAKMIYQAKSLVFGKSHFAFQGELSPLSLARMQSVHIPAALRAQFCGEETKLQAFAGSEIPQNMRQHFLNVSRSPEVCYPKCEKSGNKFVDVCPNPCPEVECVPPAPCDQDCPRVQGCAPKICPAPLTCDSCVPPFEHPRPKVIGS